MKGRFVMRYPIFTKGDLDGFFGLAVDNLVQVLVIAALCKQLCGFTDQLLFSAVFPGIAISLLIGNLFYAFHAHYVARRDNNVTCTALPFGINTPSVFAYILFILAPVYARYQGTLGSEAAGQLAWKIGLLACIGSGIIEFVGAFIGNWIRQVTPRAALLSALAAIGIIFIASPFAFQIFERPLVAMLPLFIVLIGYFAHVRFPLGMPSGLVAVLVGTLLAWTVPLVLGPKMMSPELVRASTHFIGLHTPIWCWDQIIEVLKSDRTLLYSFLGVIVPMGLINAIGSLQNIESAEAAGDRFSTGPCMAVNGICTIAAGLFGSCFPTTIYIGHPGWKALGARSGYSILNGMFFTVAFLFGLGAMIVSIIPMEAGMAIVLWIGIIIAAQCYEAVPTRHYPAVAIGFFPSVAMMAVFLVPYILPGLGMHDGILPMIHQHGETVKNTGTDAWWPIGVYALAGANSGFVITCIIISAASACLIDNRFKSAGIWLLIGAGMTLLGFQHAFRIEPGALSPQELLIWQRPEKWFERFGLYTAFPEGTYPHRAYRIAGGYFLGAALCLAIHVLRRRGDLFEDLIDPHMVPAMPRRVRSPISQPFIETGGPQLMSEPAGLPASRLTEHDEIALTVSKEALSVEKKQVNDPDVQRSEGEGMVVHPMQQASPPAEPPVNLDAPNSPDTRRGP
jgi:AGZA family xanthine/uracil permease-like MFS transporter